MWVWHLCSSLRGFCFGTVVPGFLAPFYRCCGWRCGTWVVPVLLAWTSHCFRLGAWSLGLASSSVACHPSPSQGLARLGVHVCLHFLKCCLYFSLKFWISFLRNLSFLLWYRLIPSPSPSQELARLGVHVCLHFLKCCLYFSLKFCISFLRNLSFLLWYRLIPSLPRAPSIFMPGFIRKRGWVCWSGSSSTSLHGS